MKGLFWQRGTALGERLIMITLAVLFIGLFAATYSHSPKAAFAITGGAAGVGAGVFAYGYYRDRRMMLERKARCVQALEQAAAAEHTSLDAAFVDPGMAAGFGVAGAVGRIFFARGFPAFAVVNIALDQVTAAFARPDGARGYRLELRVRPAVRGEPSPAHWVRTESLEEARRWVRALEPLLGARVKWVEHGKDEG
jgi:hypothetical protein